MGMDISISAYQFGIIIYRLSAYVYQYLYIYILLYAICYQLSVYRYLCTYLYTTSWKIKIEI